jgi:hypothetical protein
MMTVLVLSVLLINVVALVMVTVGPATPATQEEAVFVNLLNVRLALILVPAAKFVLRLVWLESVMNALQTLNVRVPRACALTVFVRSVLCPVIVLVLMLIPVLRDLALVVVLYALVPLLYVLQPPHVLNVSLVLIVEMAQIPVLPRVFANVVLVLHALVPPLFVQLLILVLNVPPMPNVLLLMPL